MTYLAYLEYTEVCIAAPLCQSNILGEEEAVARKLLTPHHMVEGSFKGEGKGEGEGGEGGRRGEGVGEGEGEGRGGEGREGEGRGDGEGEGEKDRW